MGVPGLTSFINRNSTQYFENYQLKDIVVIIDGYALTNFLYSQYENQTSAFGGDYDIMVNVYIDFINWFLRCNIIPVFVFDGAYEQRKIETIMQRMSQRIMSYNQNITNNNCMPYFGSDILFNILNDLDIPHITCDFEADAEIVALAKLLDCPVLSRDSDFYLNTVAYIPLDMITIDLKSSEKAINCRMYKVEKLLNEFGQLQTKFLPLISALLGNDYIKPDTFARLLKLNPGTYNCGLKLKRITDWLRKQTDVSNAIHNMTNNLSNRDYIRKQIINIVQEYKNVDSKYLSFILQYKNMSIYQDRFKNNVQTSITSILPLWLEDNYRKSIINSDIMTFVTMKKIFFKVCVENIEKPPIHECSFKILEIIMGLLFNTNDSIVGIGRRNGFNIGQYKIKPYINNPYVPLADLNKTDIEYRKNIILNLVGIKNFNGVPKEWELFILILIYWTIQTNNRNTSQMHALIVCAMVFNIIKKTAMDSQNEKFEISEILNLTDKSILEQNIFNVKKDDCLKSMEVLSKFFVVNHCGDKNLHYQIIHSFSQFQCCAYFIMILNSLLDFPYKQCRIEHFFKGTFLYNLCVEMKCFNPEKFISEQLFNKLDSLNKIYKSLISHLNILLSISKRRVTAINTSSNAKPKARKKKEHTKII